MDFLKGGAFAPVAPPWIRHCQNKCSIAWIAGGVVWIVANGGQKILFWHPKMWFSYLIIIKQVLNWSKSEQRTVYFPAEPIVIYMYIVFKMFSPTGI